MNAASLSKCRTVLYVQCGQCVSRAGWSGQRELSSPRSQWRTMANVRSVHCWTSPCNVFWPRSTVGDWDGGNETMDEGETAVNVELWARAALRQTAVRTISRRLHFQRVVNTKTATTTKRLGLFLQHSAWVSWDRSSQSAAHRESSSYQASADGSWTTCS